jgi:serine/threonine protein kinase
VLHYEGLNPFFFEGMSQMHLYHSIVEDVPMDAKGASENAKDLINKLLQKDPAERLGSLAKGELDILEHPWFAGLDLLDLRRRLTPAPWVAKLKHALDTSCFDDWDHLVDKMAEGSPDLLDSEQALFKDF